MYYLLKKITLSLFKLMGFFRLSSFLSRKKLRILCYHGFAYDRQDEFRPKLFIKERTFANRIKFLLDSNFKFINQNTFDTFLNGHFICDYPVLLTIDDGWKSSHDLALPILKKNNIPHILYLYTDCFQREIPVVDVLLQYALWMTPLDDFFYAKHKYNLTKNYESAALLEQIVAGYSDLEAEKLNEQLEKIFKLLNVDYSKEREWESFRLLNHSELEEHVQNRGSIQLHTHHHINPLQDAPLKDELLKNKRCIESITGQSAEHFCYPSGVYSKDQFSLLKKLGIKSAVTCEPGLNDSKTHAYELKRFLDGENISQIEFEAEISGFLHICRRFFKRGQ